MLRDGRQPENTALPNSISKIREKYTEYFITSFHNQTIHALQNIPVWMAFLQVLYYVLLAAVHLNANNHILISIAVAWIGIPLLTTWGTYKNARHWQTTIFKQAKIVKFGDPDYVQSLLHGTNLILATIIFFMSLSEWFSWIILGKPIKSPINFFTPLTMSLSILLPSLQFFYYRERWGITKLRKFITWSFPTISIVLIILSFQLLEFYTNSVFVSPIPFWSAAHWIRPDNTPLTQFELIMIISLTVWVFINFLFRWRLIRRAALFATRKLAQDRFTKLINISDRYHLIINRAHYRVLQAFRNSPPIKATIIFFIGALVIILFWFGVNLAAVKFCPAVGQTTEGQNQNIAIDAAQTTVASTQSPDDNSENDARADCILENSPLSAVGLLNAAFTGGITLVFTYYLYRQFQARRRYIVVPFTEIGDPDDGELQAIANLMTHTLVSELQHIGKLLSFRQVENAYNIDSIDSNAQFVTSGQIHGFAEQIQHLEGVEFTKGSFKFSFGGILTQLFLSWADVRVQGKIHRRTNGTLEILTEMTLRNAQTITAEEIIIPDNSASDIDEITASQIGHELASKLVLQLAQGQQVATTATSLDYFLKGIEASSQRKWWLAISHYRRAIEIEETQQGVVGLMHYHLGAALFFQGDTDAGLRHLEIAETNGFVLPENLYMIARAHLHRHWDELHLREDRFNEIRLRCLKALKLRKDFPEAAHLLGISYYRLAALKQRDSTQQWDINNVKKSPYNKIYFQSVKYLRRTIRQYDRRLSSDVNQKNGNQEQQKIEKKRLSDARLMAAHQLGNAYRALRGFVEAEMSYQEVLLAYPRNIKVLVDLSKTYCLAQNWQRADSFLRKNVLQLDQGYWHAGANFYTGWFLAGGLVDRHHLPRVHNLIYKILDRNPVGDIKILIKAMRHFDYALHQRPRFMLSRWAHNDWLNILKQAIAIEAKGNNRKLKTMAIRRIVETPLEVALNTDTNVLLAQIILWLSLRMLSYAAKHQTGTALNHPVFNAVNQYLLCFITADSDDSSGNDLSNQITDPLLRTLPKRIKQLSNFFPDYGALYIRLMRLRVQAAEIISSIDSSVRVAGMKHTFRRLEFAEEAVQLWEDVQILFDQEIKPGGESQPLTFTFKDRIVVDLYAEIALLAIRFLYEGEAYEHAFFIASRAGVSLNKWRNKWDRNYREKEFYFSPNVFRYQFATVHAWKAASALNVRTDQASQLRLRVLWNNETTEVDNVWKTLDDMIRDENILRDEVQAAIDLAFSMIRLHPLAMYAQAQLHRQTGLLSQASTEFNHLLKVIAQFSTLKYMQVRQTGRINVDSHAQNYNLRKYLSIAEKVSGQLQFEYVVDEANIHMALAELYDEMKKHDLGINHLHTALRWSPHIDLYSEYFIELTRRLTFNERFDEAEAVLEAIKVPEIIMSNHSLSIQKRKDPSIALCVTLTRQWKHGQSFELGQEIARNFRIYSLEDRPLRYSLLENYRAVYDEVKLALKKQDEEFRTQHLEKLAERQHDWHCEKVVLQNNQETFFDTMPNIFMPDTINSVSSLANKNKLGVLYLIPRIFKNLFTHDESEFGLMKPVEALEQAVFMVYLHRELFAGSDGNQEATENLLALLEAPSGGKFSKEPVIKSRILLFFLAESQLLLIQLAELANTLAFNKAELDIRHYQAFEDARFAILIMRILVELGTKSLYSRKLKELRSTLAQYYDTLGWIYYRANNNFVAWHKEDILNKVAYLPFSLQGIVPADQEQDSPDIMLLLYVARHQLEQGLKYDTRRAIIHYHLARVHATNLEHMWQRIPDKTEHSHISEISPYVNMHLRNADRHWRYAKKFDTVDRFHSQLTWLRKRIEVYREAWHNRQVTMFRGEP